MVSTPNSGRYRGEHDPYNNMESADIRPGYIARQELSEAEQGASDKSNVSSQDSIRTNSRGGRTLVRENATQSAKSSEQNQKSNNFINSVKGKNGKNGGKRGFLKKTGPIAVITSLLLGGGAFFYGAQSMLGPHLSSLYTNATDVQFSSYNFRNARIMSYMLDGGGQIKINNFTTKYTTFTPYMQSRLKSKGIEVGHLNSSGEFVSGQAIFGNSTVLKYDNEIIDASHFQDAFASNANFRESYYEAKRGRIAGFFDDVSMKYYDQKGATRDIFDDYKSTGDTDVDTVEFKQTVSDYVVGADGSVSTIRHGVDEETQEEYLDKSEEVSTKNVDGDTPEVKARSMVNSIAAKVSSVGVPVCSALRIANLAAVAVSAYQIYQSIAYFLSLMEPISKTMAGEGDQSAINETLNFMTSQYTTKVDYVNSDGKQQTKNVTGSMLESTGSKLIMGNTKSPASETAPYSFDNITKAATTIAISTGATNVVCSGVMAASAIVSLASAGVPGGKLATFAVSMIAKTIGGVVITGVVAAIVSAIIPYVAKIFASNIFETYTGIPAGELFSQGAATANFSLATQGSAYMPSDTEAVKTQNRKTTLALAQEAEVDRLNRSPFDITSTNTFMGSLLSKFSYMAYSSNVVGAISSFNNITATAIRKLTPASSAADEELMYTSNYSECRGNSNAACDMYGLPIVTSDYSTIDIKPDDPTYESVVSRNLDSNGNIKEGSELAKFINFCKNRNSPWFVKDANILNALQTDFGIVVNNIPYVNDILDIVNAAEDVANEPWATGDICMNTSSNSRWDSEFKYYQRYIEDMRIIGGMEEETGGSNPVLAYEAKYEATHPIDTSFEGTLARISGLTKNDVAFLMEYTRYSTEIANYDPSERYSFIEVSEPEKIHFEENIIPDYSTVITKSEPIFIDKRNYLV